MASAVRGSSSSCEEQSEGPSRSPLANARHLQIIKGDPSLPARPAGRLKVDISSASRYYYKCLAPTKPATTRNLLSILTGVTTRNLLSILTGVLRRQLGKKSIGDGQKEFTGGNKGKAGYDRKAPRGGVLSQTKQGP